jgi:hypothetical protein
MTGDRYDDLAATVAALAEQGERDGRGNSLDLSRQLRALLGGDTSALDAIREAVYHEGWLDGCAAHANPRAPLQRNPYRRRNPKEST